MPTVTSFVTFGFVSGCLAISFLVIDTYHWKYLISKKIDVRFSVISVCDDKSTLGFDINAVIVL